MYFCLISSGTQAGRPLLGTCILAHFPKPSGWARGGRSPFSHCRLCPVTPQTVRSSSWWGEPSFSPLDPPLPRSHVTLPASSLPPPGMVPMTSNCQLLFHAHSERTADGLRQELPGTRARQHLECEDRGQACVIDQEGKAGGASFRTACSGVLGRGRAMTHRILEVVHLALLWDLVPHPITASCGRAIPS